MTDYLKVVHELTYNLSIKLLNFVKSIKIDVHEYQWNHSIIQAGKLVSGKSKQLVYYTEFEQSVMYQNKPYEVKEQRHQVSVFLFTKLWKQTHGLPQVEPKVDFIWFLSCVMWSTALYKKLSQTVIYLHWLLLLLLLWVGLVFCLVNSLLWKEKNEISWKFLSIKS